MNAWILMLLMVVLASLFECMTRIKNCCKSLNHLIIHDHNPNDVRNKMSCRRFERLLRRSPSPTPSVRGRGQGQGCGRGRDVNLVPFILEEEAPPVEEQPLEDPPI